MGCCRGVEEELRWRVTCEGGGLWVDDEVNKNE